MDKLKQWVAFTLVGVLAVLAAGWFLLVAPKRTHAKELNAQTASQETVNQGLRTSLAVLKAQAKDEPKQEAKIARVASKIPDNPALPELIRNLDRASAATGVDLKTMAPGLPSAAAVPVAKAGTPATPRAPTSAGAVAARPAASSAAAGALGSIPVSITISGTYFQILEFVDQLEGLTRAFKVTALSVSPGSTNSPGASATTLVASVSGNVYLAAGRLPVAAVNIPKSGK
jgi:Tfp pilus assembly protein PilO